VLSGPGTTHREAALPALRQNGPYMPNGHPRFELVAPSASPEEAAAIVAALERFMRDTAPSLAAPVEAIDPWQRVAMLEGVSREGRGDEPDPWINT
jgi:hypothetical protein